MDLWATQARSTLLIPFTKTSKRSMTQEHASQATTGTLATTMEMLVK
jgi:hypothetical protein